MIIENLDGKNSLFDGEPLKVLEQFARSHNQQASATQHQNYNTKKGDNYV